MQSRQYRRCKGRRCAQREQWRRRRTTDGSETSTGQPEPSREEVWAANFGDNKQSYVAAVATALALTPNEVDAASGALGTCLSLQAKRKDRSACVAGVGIVLARQRAVVRASAGGARRDCDDHLPGVRGPPEDADSRARDASAGREKRLRREQERRQQERAARAAARQRAAQKAKQQNVYYGNCTDVENAGAAPIYAGDPGS